MGSISAEDRCLIDEAIAAGKVQRVPTGASGLGDEIIWDETKNQLVYRDPKAAKAAISTTGIFGGQGRKGRRKGATPQTLDRRRRVAELVAEGLTGREIQERLAAEGRPTPMGTIYNDVHKQGLKLPYMPQRVRFEKGVAERRAKVKAAFDGIRTVPEISRHVGLSQRAVRDHLAALELEAPKGRPGGPRKNPTA